MLDKCVFKLLRDFAVEEMFSYELLDTRKEEKLSTEELPPRGVQDSPLSFFCPTSCSSQESEGFFLPMSYIQGQVQESQEAVESAREGLLPQEGDVRKSRKEKDQGRREGGSSEGNVPCALNQEFVFFGSRVFGFRSGPSRLKYRLLRDLVYEEAMCEGSSGNGLLYAVKAVP
jgi:hypothetical protein